MILRPCPFLWPGGFWFARPFLSVPVLLESGFGGRFKAHIWSVFEKRCDFGDRFESEGAVHHVQESSNRLEGVLGAVGRGHGVRVDGR